MTGPTLLIPQHTSRLLWPSLFIQPSCGAHPDSQSTTPSPYIAVSKLAVVLVIPSSDSTQSRHRHRFTVTVASYSSSNTDEEPEHLPYPATKLIIAQYWHSSRDPPYWGYLIVGTFYDQHNNIVWSTEIFAFQPDPRRRQDTQSVASSEPDVDSASNNDLNDRFARSLNLAHSTHRPRDQAHAPRYPYHHHPHGQHLWNPALAGPVPGHWVTEYNQQLGNWVNTWQPNHLRF